MAADPKIDPRIDDYIAARADFARPILTWLRARVHAACPEVEEAIKWSMPAFGYRGRPLANMAAFKAHATFGFWDRQALATGMEGEAMGQYGRIARLEDLPAAAVIEDQIRAAMARIDAGTTAAVPEALADALATDAVAAAAFAAFPPGCRREYCEWIDEAKRPATRDKRVAEAVAWIREGKRRNWKYESC